MKSTLIDDPSSDDENMEGLGDMVAKALERLGATKIVNKCRACEERRKYLNQKVPFKQK